MDSIELKIKEILSRPKYGIKPNKISLGTTIQSLGFGSDEIYDFFKEFGEEFNINGEGYNYYDYFYEDMHPLIMLRDLFLRVFRREKVKKKMITIEHLIKVAKAGKWIVPE